jgi:hypothetical protein
MLVTDLFFRSMTIPNLAVNLSGVFEFGQAYVGELFVYFGNNNSTCSMSVKFSHSDV